MQNSAERFPNAVRRASLLRPKTVGSLLLTGMLGAVAMWAKTHVGINWKGRVAWKDVDGALEIKIPIGDTTYKSVSRVVARW